MFHYYQPTKIHFGAGQLSELGHVCKSYGKILFSSYNTGCTPTAVI